MEKTSGNQGFSKEHGKNQNYGLLQKPALTQRLRKTPLWCGKHLCVVCRLCCVVERVGSKSIFRDGCQSWIDKKCSGFRGRLKADPKCKRCMGLCRPVYGRHEKHGTLEGIQFDIVDSFRYW